MNEIFQKEEVINCIDCKDKKIRKSPNFSTMEVIDYYGEIME